MYGGAIAGTGASRCWWCNQQKGKRVKKPDPQIALLEKKQAKLKTKKVLMKK